MLPPQAVLGIKGPTTCFILSNAIHHQQREHSSTGVPRIQLARNMGYCRLGPLSDTTLLPESKWRKRRTSEWYRVNAGSAPRKNSVIDLPATT